MADAKQYHFKDPGTHLRINGQVFHQGNLTEETYLYIVGWSKDYEALFSPGPPPPSKKAKAAEAETEEPLKPKRQSRGQVTSSTSEE
jgi:hypothetical protein